MSRIAPVTQRYERSLAYLGGKHKLPLVKEELWRDEDGTVTRYSLAYIDPLTFTGDNGRVLGYDNAHGHHHRHFCGEVTSVDYRNYESLAKMFLREVARLRRR